MDRAESGQAEASPALYPECLLTLKEAAYQARKSQDTIIRWNRAHGIGRQLHPHAPWRVDAVGLAIVMAGDAEALKAYKRRDRASPALAPYLGRAAA